MDDAHSKMRTMESWKVGGMCTDETTQVTLCLLKWETNRDPPIPFSKVTSLICCLLFFFFWKKTNLNVSKKAISSLYDTIIIGLVFFFRKKQEQRNFDKRITFAFS